MTRGPGLNPKELHEVEVWEKQRKRKGKITETGKTWLERMMS